MTGTKHKLTPSQQATKSKAAVAYKALTEALTAFTVAMKKGGVYRIFCDQDTVPFSLRDVAPTSDHICRVEKLCAQVSDVYYRNDDNTADNYYGIVGLSNHAMECLRALNRAKENFRAAMPNERERLTGGITLGRVILRGLAPGSSRINLLSLTRQLPEVSSIDIKTRADLEAIAYSTHINHKANKISYAEARKMTEAYAIQNGYDVASICSALPSDDGTDSLIITKYDKTPRVQGSAQFMYRDRSTNRLVQRVKKVAMPCFYDAQLSPNVELRRSTKQKNKHSGKGEFHNSRILIDLGTVALCKPPAKSLMNEIENSRKGRPF